MEADSNQSLENRNLKSPVHGTRIATPTGEKSMELFKKGDSVLAFSAKPESGKIKLTSSEAKVSISAGTGPFGNFPMMIYIQTTDYKEIICDGAQLFLLINGKYIQAGRLIPGEHKLVDKDGNPVGIEMVQAGSYHGGIHDISTDVQGHNPDGHLLLAQGVIMGDFTLQVYFDYLPEDLKE